MPDDLDRHHDIDHRDDPERPATAAGRGSLLTAGAALALATGAVPVALAAGASVPEAILAAGSTFTTADAVLAVITARVRRTLDRRHPGNDPGRAEKTETKESSC